mmetsp:Transcript_17754/g.31528  ORF Transcript_17754/g.31528 Transcript_17754/m.31528 type:complete len:207 (-) Transcript_17754:178-798(-)
MDQLEVLGFIPIEGELVLPRLSLAKGGLDGGWVESCRFGVHGVHRRPHGVLQQRRVVFVHWQTHHILRREGVLLLRTPEGTHVVRIGVLNDVPGPRCAVGSDVTHDTAEDPKASAHLRRHLTADGDDGFIPLVRVLVHSVLDARTEGLFRCRGGRGAGGQVDGTSGPMLVQLSDALHQLLLLLDQTVARFLEHAIQLVRHPPSLRH